MQSPPSRSRERHRLGAWRGDRGSAPVEFVLLTPLTVAVAVAVLQFALLLQMRATLIATAADGARVGALRGNQPQDAVRRARDLATATAGRAAISSVTAKRVNVDGLDVITVHIAAAIGLFAGIGTVTMEVDGHALVEAVP